MFLIFDVRDPTNINLKSIDQGGCCTIFFFSPSPEGI